MAQQFCNLWLEEDGQDVVEYSMLLAVIVLLCLAFAFAGTTSVHGIWGQSNSLLVSANSAGSGS